MHKILIVVAVLVVSGLSYFAPQSWTAAAAQTCASHLPRPPTAAIAQGYTCATFDSPFANFNNLDLSDSLKPGYQWYIHNTWRNYDSGCCWTQPILPSDISGDRGNFIYNGDIYNPGNSSGLQTAAWLGGSKHIGRTFKPGFYVDLEAAYNPAVPSSTNGWPAFWAMPIEALTNRIACKAYYAELDFFEAYAPIGRTRADPIMTVNEWQNCTNYHDWNSNQAISIAQDGAFHHYGTLVVPRSDNDGIGKVLRYFDGNEIVSNRIFYSTSDEATSSGFRLGGLTEIDGSNYVLILSTGKDWPLAIRRVTVWQKAAGARFKFGK